MGQGQSYSFPMDSSGSFSFLKSSNVVSLDFNSYLQPYNMVFNISEKKCDFNNVLDKASAKDYLDKTVWWSPCAGMSSLGNSTGLLLYLTGNGYPNACNLNLGKKYYLNVRWLHKSDLIDASGKIRNDESPIFSKLRDTLRSKSITELNQYLNDTFNGYGDSCLATPPPDSGGQCAIDPDFGSDIFSPAMSKLNSTAKARIGAAHAK